MQRRGLYVPRLTERRPDERGSGGRNSNTGITVAMFGASGFLGCYVCGNNGAFCHEKLLTSGVLMHYMIIFIHRRIAGLD